MALSLDYCPILGDDVIVILDLEGNLKNVGYNRSPGGSCPEFNQDNCRCEKKLRTSATLVGIDGRIIDTQSDPKGQYCEFFDPNSMWCS